MPVFKRRRFPAGIILICVRWYCKYGISYRDLAEMMQERGVAVDHTTIFRWVQRYAPEIEKRVRRCQGYRSASCRVEAKVEAAVLIVERWLLLRHAVKGVRFRLNESRADEVVWRWGAGW